MLPPPVALVNILKLAIRVQTHLKFKNRKAPQILLVKAFLWS